MLYFDLTNIGKCKTLFKTHNGLPKEIINNQKIWLQVSCGGGKIKRGVFAAVYELAGKQNHFFKGIYFVRLPQGKQSEVRKVIVK